MRKTSLAVGIMLLGTCLTIVLAQLASSHVFWIAVAGLAVGVVLVAYGMKRTFSQRVENAKQIMRNKHVGSVSTETKEVNDEAMRQIREEAIKNKWRS
ncbi:MAG: hypothetical protein WAL55_15150 [Candidatus Acidiferrales bacterium]